MIGSRQKSVGEGGRPRRKRLRQKLQRSLLQLRRLSPQRGLVHRRRKLLSLRQLQPRQQKQLRKAPGAGSPGHTGVWDSGRETVSFNSGAKATKAGAQCLHLRFQQPFRPSATCRPSSGSWGTILCRRPTHLPFSAWGTQMKCRQEEAAIQLPHSWGLHAPSHPILRVHIPSVARHSLK